MDLVGDEEGFEDGEVVGDLEGCRVGERVLSVGLKVVSPALLRTVGAEVGL